MVKQIEKQGKKIFQCEECGFYYKTKGWAEKCEAFCGKNKSCSLEIIKHAVNYICPMHPEVRRSKPGRCPKCGMKLVPEKNIPKINSIRKDDNYLPLIVIVGLILLTALAISYRDFLLGSFDILKTITYFMAGFFIVFAGFKLIDLKGFAQGYFTYDILASRWFAYGYIYPFIELFFGFAMILIPQASWILWSEIVVMTFSGFGVVNKLLKKEKFQCVCLGTFLKVPLTKITLVEDFGMALLAAILLWLL